MLTRRQKQVSNVLIVAACVVGGTAIAAGAWVTLITALLVLASQLIMRRGQ